MSMAGLNASLAPHEDYAARFVGVYKNTKAKIFGEAPSFDAMSASIVSLEDQ